MFGHLRRSPDHSSKSRIGRSVLFLLWVWIGGISPKTEDFQDFSQRGGARLSNSPAGEYAGLEKSAAEAETFKLAANYFTSDLLGLIKEKQIPASEFLIEPENFSELIKMIYKKEITSRVAKDVLRHMVEQGGDPSTIVEEKGLKQVSDSGALEEAARKVILNNPKTVEDYKKGKAQALQFLVGQMMKETKGAANPEIIREILARLI